MDFETPVFARRFVQLQALLKQKQGKKGQEQDPVQFPKREHTRQDTEREIPKEKGQALRFLTLLVVTCFVAVGAPLERQVLHRRGVDDPEIFGRRKRALGTPLGIQTIASAHRFPSAQEQGNSPKTNVWLLGCHVSATE